MAVTYKSANEKCTCKLGRGTTDQQAEILRLAYMGERRSQAEWNGFVTCFAHRQTAGMVERMVEKERKQTSKTRRDIDRVLVKSAKKSKSARDILSRPEDYLPPVPLQPAIDLAVARYRLETEKQMLRDAQYYPDQREFLRTWDGKPR